VHLLENVVQRQDEPVQGPVLADALGPDLLGAHAIHLLDEEISLLAQRDVRVAHNPLSNMRLASGIIRLPALHHAGVKVGLGLDGGTNDTSDMFNTMRVAVGLQRATSLQACIFPTVSEVLRMATLGGAEVLDMAASIGSLKPGKQADVVILDPRGVNFAPRLDWINQIVFNGQPANVDWVFVHGRPLKAGGRMVGADSTAIVQAAEEAARRLRNALHVP
jgi:5-methylthioadenosine/S-adenosylhomocysteine deaminase